MKIACCLLLLSVGAVNGQLIAAPDGSGGGTGEMAAEMAEIQAVQERLIGDAAPVFWGYQKKLRAIEAEIGEILVKLANKDIDRRTAKERILPLINEDKGIRSDPDYLAEQRLAQVSLSSPEYRVKMERMMRAFNKKQKRRLQNLR